VSTSVFPSPSHRPGDTVGEKDEINRKTIYSTLGNFGEASIILNSQNILVYLDWMNLSHIQSWGRLIIKDSSAYKTFIDIMTPYDIPNFGDFKFIVYIHREVRENDSLIFKVFTIAHEIQHILQSLEHLDVFHITAVLKGYFMIGERFKNDIYRIIPTEVDAFRKAKSIAHRMFSKAEVTAFIEQEIQNSNDENEGGYWGNIKGLDIEKDYDLKKETQIFWDKYRNEIHDKINELKQRLKVRELAINEKNFLEALDLCLKYCSGGIK
jgi:hypothetical protein